MPTDYAAITAQNILRYGTDVSKYGPVLLANLYSDRTHFVYELIQNAEDAGARWVSFHLYNDRLEIRHNGRPFNFDDVQGICGLVEGTKGDDLTKIGKFGIGFKSVYAYTSAPQVYSGDEAFCIRNYVHPEATAYAGSAGKDTLFVLPFCHESVPPDTAFHEIASRLRNLGLRTLLFLQHIDEISWHIQGGEEGTYLREPKPISPVARRVYLLSKTSGQDEREEEWLIFARPLRASGLRVEVGYQMAWAKDQEDAGILPTRNAVLVVFFETHRETHLQFLIQGPFRTTPARDNIPEYDPWNKQLIGEIASLVADSITYVKEMGLLTVSFLNVLPISPEDFPEAWMFRPIYDAVLAKLGGKEALLPDSNGGFISADHAYLARGRELTDLLDQGQLQSLFERNGRWLAVEITRDRTPALRNYLMSKLDVLEVDSERFARQLSREFLADQSDAWIIEFCRYLSDHKVLIRRPSERRDRWGRVIETQEAGILYGAPILRLSDSSHVSLFASDGKPSAYLPGDFGSSVTTVKESIAKDPDARLLLVGLGFEECDVYAEVVELVVPKYQQLTRGVGYQEGLDDCRKITQALKRASKERRDALIYALRNLPFLVGRRPSGEKACLYPPGKRIYVPKSYSGDDALRTFLDRLGASEDVIWLDDRYQGVIDSQLLDEIGCVVRLDRVEEVRRQILPRYRGGQSEVSESRALQDAIAVVEVLGERDTRNSSSPLEKELQDVPFLRAVNAKSKELQWAEPPEVYLGAAYTGDEDLERYFDGNANAKFLADFYEGHLSDDALRQLGCPSRVRITYRRPTSEGYVHLIHRHSHHERGLDGFDPGFQVDGLSHALSSILDAQSVELARVVWTLVKPYWKTIYGEVQFSTTASFVRNQKTEPRASAAGLDLRLRSWLPHRDGGFHTPSELRLSDLPESFDTKSTEARQLAVKLGCRPEVDLSDFTPEERERITFALTITEEEIEELRKWRDAARATEPEIDYQDELRRRFNRPQGKTPELHHPPAGPVPDPERRRERAVTQVLEAKASEQSPPERFVRVPTKVWQAKDSAARTFLQEEYRGKCQICGDSFLKRDGEPYFEGLYLVSRTKAAWVDRPGNVLCLCATCCAKLLHGEVETEDDIVDELLHAVVGRDGRVEIALRLCGESARLTFGERHFIELQAMLMVEDKR